MANDKRSSTDAFTMLARCHRQIEQRMAQLREASAALATATETTATDNTDEACDAIVEVLAYLNRSAARHVADEEKSLFPRLRAANVDDELLCLIESEHKDHDRLHNALAANVRAWRTRPPSAAQIAELGYISAELATAYDQHIALEESALVPLVNATLSAQQLDDVFAEMRSRRGKGRGRSSQSGKRGSGSGSGSGGGKKRLRQTR